jgi:hypothetical protein
MIQKIKNRLLVLSAAALFAVPLAAPVMAHAADVQGSLCQGAQNLEFGAPTACDKTVGEDKLNTTIATVINILSVIVGVIAVIMIIIGGFRYITSGGDSTKVGAAKNTILYALIGLIIVAIAQVIVRFVLGKATTIGS